MALHSAPGVLLFGGSFDPIHHGHLICARHLAERLGLGRVVLIPSATPPHKLGKALAAAVHRLAMCRLATEGDALFGVSDWEIGQPGPNYTLLTVRHFAESLGAATPIYWLIGMDGLLELETWHKVGELVDACTIVTALRPGYERPAKSAFKLLGAAQIERLVRGIVETPRIDISATQVRERAQQGRSIRYLVPEIVRTYIEEHRLYRGG